MYIPALLRNSTSKGQAVTETIHCRVCCQVSQYWHLAKSRIASRVQYVHHRFRNGMEPELERASMACVVSILVEHPKIMAASNEQSDCLDLCRPPFGESNTKSHISPSLTLKDVGCNASIFTSKKCLKSVLLAYEDK